MTPTDNSNGKPEDYRGQFMVTPTDTTATGELEQEVKKLLSEHHMPLTLNRDVAIGDNIDRATRAIMQLIEAHTQALIDAAVVEELKSLKSLAVTGNLTADSLHTYIPINHIDARIAARKGQA